MATITSTLVDTTFYTVQNASFPISDARATRAVSGFGALTLSLSVVEDKLILNEKAFKSAIKKVPETVRTTEKIAKSSTKKILETLNFIDDFNRTGQFSLLFTEGIIFVDNCIKKLSKPIKEYFGISSWFFNKTELKKIENLKVAEIFERIAVFDVKLSENIDIVPQPSKKVTVNHSESLAISSKIFKGLEALKKENIRFYEKLSNKTIFKRIFAETIYNIPKLLKTFNLSQKEFIKVEDIYIRHANAVISDISLSMGEITLEEFLAKTSSPPGYDKFIEFVVGEYKYQDALVRMIIDAGSAKSEPLIYDMAINVDIDDTVDRGTAQITDTTKPTTIKFNKHYYHPPEVGVTVKGGIGTNVITAEIVEIREDGFDVSLYNSSRARVIGTISWTAVGY